jgi:ABC-type transport system substrate-binding protein
VRPFHYDPGNARAVLDGAGYPLRPSAERAVPIRFSFKCLVFGSDSRFERLGMIAQKELADVGIDMRLEPLEFIDLTNRMASGDFDAILMELSGPRLSRVYDFWRSSDKPTINTGYRAADKILDRLRSAPNDDDIRAAVADLLEVLHDDPPAAFIAWQKSTRAVSSRFDVAAEQDRDILTTLWRWRPASPQQQTAR